MKKSMFKKLSVSAMAMVTALSMLPAIPAYARNLEWETVGDSQFWYENDVKMGVYGAPGNVWYDGTERGKEIFDPGSDAWYWLDCCLDGAKAVGKEVFMPYIYGDESTKSASEKKALAYESNTCEENLENAKLGYQIWRAMTSGSGKWVRYDENGRMLKGWVTIEGALEAKYPDQVGNTYYYDRRTGIMAKGVVEIDGRHFEFDRITGVLIGETDQPTDEETYYANLANGGTTLVQVTSETIYDNPKEGDRNYKTEYLFGDPNRPTWQTSSVSYAFIDGEYRKTNETANEIYSYQSGTSTYTSNRSLYDRSWSWDSDSQELYLYSESSYEYNDSNNPGRYTSHLYTYYNRDGSKSSISRYSYVYDNNGKLAKETYEYVSYSSNGQVSYSSKTETTYTYNDQGKTIEEVKTHIPTSESDSQYVSSKYVYTYDENGNRIRSDYYSSTSTWSNGTYTYDLKLNSVTGYVYEEVAGRMRNTHRLTFDVDNGVVTDTVSARTDYIFNEKGDQIRTETYRLRNGELALASKSEYTYDDQGYTVTYRSYSSDSTYQNGQYVYGDLYPSSGYDYVYEDIPDDTYSSGVRHAQTKYINYVNKDKDGNMEVSYYVMYDTGFNWNVDGLGVGDTKTSTNWTYNADDTLYYHTTNTYEVKAYGYTSY